MSQAAKTLPPLFVERIRALYPGRDGEQVLASFEKERPTAFRPNTLKTDARSLRKKLEEQGFKLEALTFPPGCFLLRNRRQRDIEETESYRTGELYLQNPSSMLPPHLLLPLPGESVLDLAAAPGGKTTQMAAMMEGKGHLVAVEENAVRAEKLKANLVRQGVSYVQVEVEDGALWGRRHPESYDRVLLDAPCSAEGRFQCGEPASYRYWKENTPAQCSKLQRRLFKGAFEALKPGGRLFYSTCAISPEENEGVASWALNEYAGHLQIERLSMPLLNIRRGINGWGSQTYDPTVGRAIRVLPSAIFEGFFAVLFRKNA
jgi:NOL1/NOP2/sun family putative RNA methylase